MATGLFYLLNVILCSAVFVLCYWIVLRNEHFHRWNRFYILTAVIASVVIPLLDIPVLFPVWNTSADYVVSIALEPASVTAQAPASPGFSLISLLYGACLLTGIFFAVRGIISMIRIVMLKQRSEKLITPDYHLYYTDDESAPFTFFRSVFWKKNFSTDSPEGQYILRHELAHVRLGHSWDKVLMQFVCCFFWMNPFFLLLRRELEMVHEFEADRESVGQGNGEALSSLILCSLYPGHYRSFASSFFQSSVKRRIIMITKNNKSTIGSLRRLSIVPVIAICLYLFACKQDRPVAVTGTGTPEVAEKAVENKQVVDDVYNPDVVFSVVETMPMFNGKPAEEGFREYVGKNTQYPEKAQEQGISGRVFIEFIIDPDGNMRNVNVIRPVNPLLDNEAVRVIRESPKWTPGYQRGIAVPVKFTFPVVFKLNGSSSSDPKSPQSPASTDGIFSIVDEMPMFNGKPAEEGFREYVGKNTRYPDKAVTDGIQGRVFIEFVINPNGTLVDAKVIRPVDPLLDAEALRVINASPAWTPGKMDGKKVSVKYTFPVEFKLNN